MTDKQIAALENDYNSDWFYWTRNKHAHFIVFRDPDDRVAVGKVKEVTFASGSCKSEFQWSVTGPCWSTYQASGTEETLHGAKLAVNLRVDKIIEHEFREEYIPPLG